MNYLSTGRYYANHQWCESEQKTLTLHVFVSFHYCINSKPLVNSIQFTDGDVIM